MKYNRAILHMALVTALTLDKKESWNKDLETHGFKGVLKGTQYENINVGESPVYMPTRSQKIKSKRLKKYNSR